MDETTRSWQRRKRRSPQIGRIYYASYRDTERWCLRKLLLRVSGAASYDDLKKVPKTEDINYIAEFQDSVEEEDEEFEDEDFDLSEPQNNSQEEEEEKKMELDEEDWVSPNRQQQPLYQDNDQKAEEEFQLDEEDEIEDEEEDDTFFDANERPEKYIIRSDWTAEDYTQYETFKAACEARGFLDDEKEWDLALKEAAHSATPQQLREFFCLVLANKNQPVLYNCGRNTGTVLVEILLVKNSLVNR